MNQEEIAVLQAAYEVLESQGLYLDSDIADEALAYIEANIAVALKRGEEGDYEQ